ncbi:MAG: TonB-dependent receptor, partial [Emcibacter sp.]|nr:TonB-dependent receptor [Emcibacter sp.]
MPINKTNLLIATSFIALLGGGVASAQEQAENQTAEKSVASNLVIESIVVTAQRRSQSVQDVPIAIAAFGGEQLKAIGVSQPIDIAAQTPGLFIKNGIGSANPYISIRNVGQSLFVTNASQPVGMYVNDVNLSYTSLMSQPLYDVERVEVLKGPQGTLFGRNSTGGALSIFTNSPSDENEGSITVQGGNNALFETEGFLNLVLSDQFATRLAFKTKKQDGFFTNTLNGNKIGETDIWAARLSNRWDANDNLSINLVLETSFDRSGNAPWTSYGFADPTDPVTNADLIALGTATGDGVDFSNGNAFGRNEVYGNSSFVTGFDGSLGTDACGEHNSLSELMARNISGQCVTHTGQSGDGDLYTGGYSLEPRIIHDMYSAVLNVVYDFDEIQLTSVTGYINSDRVLEEEFDGTAAISADNTYRSKTEVFSQEFRLGGETDFVEWVGGLYYSHDVINTADTYEYDDIWFFTHLVAFEQKTRNVGIFGHTKWTLTDNFAVNFAGRYTNETISFDGGTSVINVVDADLDVQGYGLPLIEEQRTNPPAGFEKTESNVFTWKAGLEYQAFDDTMFYAFASKGVKSGGYNGTWTVSDDELRPYASEKLMDYEIGFKSMLLDSSLRINGGAFYYDYQNLQAFVLNSDFLFVVDNIPKTKVVGAELDIYWLPTENLDVRAGLSYTDAKIKEVTADQMSNGINVDNSTANSASLMFNGLVKYTRPVGEYNISGQIDFNYQSETFFTVQNTRAASQGG